jgi:hypothetical protein
MNCPLFAVPPRSADGTFARRADEYLVSRSFDRCAQAEDEGEGGLGCLDMDLSWKIEGASGVKRMPEVYYHELYGAEEEEVRRIHEIATTLHRGIGREAYDPLLLCARCNRSEGGEARLLAAIKEIAVNAPKIIDAGGG